MPLIDTHCHLNDRELMRSAPQLISRAQSAGVEKILVVGYDMPTSEAAIELADKHSCVYASVGMHPHDAKKLDAAALKRLEELAGNPKCVAFGEMGLDFYRNLSPQDVQQSAFIAQIELAAKLQLPLIVHSREADDEVLEILEKHKPAELNCVLHCFSGDVQHVKRGNKIGLYYGIDGPVTYPNAEKTRKSLCHMPDSKIVIETDAPWLTPNPYRGKKNEPSYLPLIAGKVAETLRMSVEEVGKLTSNNALTLFSKMK